MTHSHTGRYLESGTPTAALRQEYDLLVTEFKRCFGPLSSEHKALLDIILRHGGTFTQVAHLRGEHAATVSRRFHRLLANLTGRTVAVRRRPMRLSSLEKTILIEYFLCGTSQIRIAEKLAISRYRVRKILSGIRKHGPTQSQGAAS